MRERSFRRFQAREKGILMLERAEYVEWVDTRSSQSNESQKLALWAGESSLRAWAISSIGETHVV